MNNLIEKRSFKYSLFRFYVNLFYRRFYRKIEVRGTENIPWGKPIILAPNHQNALMDALAFVLWKNFQPVWLARADIFNKKTSGFLKFLKIMPIYRMRDGMSQLGKNEEIFNSAVRILKKAKVLSLFPEATHNNKRQLLPIKKGVQRIAFMAQERTDYSLDIQILPVGLFYSNYSNFNHDLLINFGKPIPQKEYNELYKEDQRKAFNELGKKIGEELSKVVVDIPGKESYDTYESFHEMFKEEAIKQVEGKKKSLLTRLNAFKKIDKELYEFESKEPAEFERICSLDKKYRALLKKNKFRDWVVKKNKFNPLKILSNFIILILGLPLFLLGLITNGLPFILPDKKIRGFLKDPQFISSFNFVLMLVIFPLFYLIICGIAALVLKSFLPLLAILVLPFLGKIAFYWYILLKKTNAIIRFVFGRKGKYKELTEIRNEISSIVLPYITR